MLDPKHHLKRMTQVYSAFAIRVLSISYLEVSLIELLSKHFQLISPASPRLFHMWECWCNKPPDNDVWRQYL